MVQWISYEVGQDARRLKDATSADYIRDLRFPSDHHGRRGRVYRRRQQVCVSYCSIAFCDNNSTEISLVCGISDGNNDVCQLCPYNLRALGKREREAHYEGHRALMKSILHYRSL